MSHTNGTSGRRPRFVYTTQRVVKIPNKCLWLTHILIIISILLYVGGYGFIWSKQYQTVSTPEHVVFTKVKGVIETKFTDSELRVLNPEFYRRVWDAVDVVFPAGGGESGGFFLLTNVLITPNQTRGTCPEDMTVEGAKCTKNSDCKKGKILNLGHGVMTGKCVNPDSHSASKTCEVEAWCPVEKKSLQYFPLRGRAALLEATKDFTVLIKNSIEFTTLGSKYRKRNIEDDTKEYYLQNCLYHPKTDPECPTFRIGDIVAYSGSDYSKVALEGAVFVIRITWLCDFDWGRTMKHCKPKYSFLRMDSQAKVAPGFNFRSANYHEENRRTLTQNYGLKFIIEVDGEGRKFDSIKMVLTIGAALGLFTIATFICDKTFDILCLLKNYLDWDWLRFYSEEMKYDLQYCECITKGDVEEAQQMATSEF